MLGDTDFSGATISNIDGLVLGARDAAGSPINASVTATLTGVQAAALTEVYGNAAIAGTVETLVVNVRDAGGVDLSTLNFVNWGSEDRVLINDSSDSNTITGTAQNDVILGNFGFDFLRGDGGDDVLGYDYGQTVGLDGGVGIDTLKLVSIQPGAVSISVNLALGSGNIIEDDSNNALDYTLSATNFENADFSLNVVNTTLIGTAGANVLIGGSGLDTITGGFGTDTLTGGGGPDLFVWNDKAEGGDTITDFEVGVDKLVFSRAAFGFASEPFDEQVYGTSAFFENYDLWSLAGLGAFSATEIQAILADFGQSTARASFIVATNAQGHSVLYFTPDSSKSSVNSGGDHTVYMIADLGSTYAPNQISLSDFVFI